MLSSRILVKFPNKPFNHLSVSKTSDIIFVRKKTSATESAETKISMDLNDLKNSFSHCSTRKMLLTSGVLHLCTWTWGIEHIAPKYISLSEKYPSLISPLSWFVKKTFYAQFCGGSSKKEVENVVGSLKKNGVGSILDPAMEEDLKELSMPEGQINQGRNIPWIMIQSNSSKMDRYILEDRIKLIKDCIYMATSQISNESATHSSPQFVAIKLTCLVPTGLLYQMNLSLDSIIHALDPKRDADSQSMITLQTWKKYINSCKKSSPTAVKFIEKLESFVEKNLFSRYGDELPARMIAFNLPSELLFEHYFYVYLPTLNSSKVETLKSKEADFIAKFSTELDFSKKIIQDIIDTASKNQVSVMIDAEQTYFQTAIHYMTFQIKSPSSAKFPTIYGTYQMYLKEGLYQLYSDMIMSDLVGIPFALKLVRGAYMDGERSRASMLKLDDPICETLGKTHEQYYKGLKHLFKDQKRRAKAIFVASHNQETLECALDYIKDTSEATGKSDDRLVMFGQLFGMSDHLTYTLAGRDLYAYKYVPVGTVHQVLPYLLRRARENSSILGRAASERKQIDLVLKSRFVRT